ncbi:unnamed protein product [Trichobilharzia regenti]|nr:unnamed protein product [Trichobilharzia regenti]
MTRVHPPCSDTIAKLIQSRAKMAQLKRIKHDTTPVSNGSYSATYSKTEKKRTRLHKTSKVSSRKGDKCQACGVVVSKTD